MMMNALLTLPFRRITLSCHSLNLEWTLTIIIRRKYSIHYTLYTVGELI